MASRFWTQGGGSDTEDDEENSLGGSEIDSENDVGEAPEKPSVSGGNKYLEKVGYGSDSSDDNRVRVIKSVKDKRLDEIKATNDQIKNGMKINDWVSLQENFDKMNKQLEKVMRATEAIKAPTLYIRALVRLEDFLAEALGNKKAKKKMSSSNARALNSMKQKLKKNNKDFEELINEFRKNHINSEAEKEEEDNSGSDDGSVEDPSNVNMSDSELDECIDGEYMKSLQTIDPHTWEYVDRLRDEPIFFVLAQNVQRYLERVGDFRSVAKVDVKLVEVVYYKPQEVYDAMRKLAEETKIGGNVETEAGDDAHVTKQNAGPPA